MIEGSSGEGQGSGEAPSISLTISRIFDRCDILQFICQDSQPCMDIFPSQYSIFLLTHNIAYQDCPSSNGTSCVPFLYPVLFWVQHGRLLHNHNIPGMVLRIWCENLNNKLFSDGKHPSRWEPCIGPGGSTIRPRIQVTLKSSFKSISIPCILYEISSW